MPGAREHSTWGDDATGYNFSILRRLSSEDLNYSMVTILNNTVSGCIPESF